MLIGGGDSMKKTVKVEGMSCEHCANRVKKALRQLDMVQDVVVNLEKGEVIIMSEQELDNNLIKEQIEDLGYIVKA